MGRDMRKSLRWMGRWRMEHAYGSTGAVDFTDGGCRAFVSSKPQPSGDKIDGGQASGHLGAIRYASAMTSREDGVSLMWMREKRRRKTEAEGLGTVSSIINGRRAH
jgi:hypothetical protein